MAIDDPIIHPPSLINAYLSEKVDLLFGVDNAVPFLPSMPTEIDALTETFPQSDGRFAVYDRMFKMRREAFPHVKGEQLLYYFYNYGPGAVTHIIRIAQLVQDLLDREDESAEEINEWLKGKIDPITGYVVIGNASYKPVYFHNFKIYQLEETRDIIDFGTARTYAGNKIVIDYKYHAS
jgi:hypothetical protein